MYKSVGINDGNVVVWQGIYGETFNSFHLPKLFNLSASQKNLEIKVFLIIT